MPPWQPRQLSGKTIELSPAQSSHGFLADHAHPIHRVQSVGNAEAFQSSLEIKSGAVSCWGF